MRRFRFTVEWEPTGDRHTFERAPGDRVIVGRSIEADLMLPYVNVSRRHFAFAFDDIGRLFVHDDMSAGGTYVDGDKVTNQEVHPGQVIWFPCGELRILSTPRAPARQDPDDDA